MLRFSLLLTLGLSTSAFALTAEANSVAAAAYYAKTVEDKKAAEIPDAEISVKGGMTSALVFKHLISLSKVSKDPAKQNVTLVRDEMIDLVVPHAVFKAMADGTSPNEPVLKQFESTLAEWVKRGDEKLLSHKGMRHSETDTSN